MRRLPGNDVLSNFLFSSGLPPRLFPSRRKGMSNANRDGDTLNDTASVDACHVDLHPPQEGRDPCRGRPGFEESSQLYIDPVECIDCGACVPVSPSRQFSRWMICPRSGPQRKLCRSWQAQRRKSTWFVSECSFPRRPRLGNALSLVQT